MSVSYTDIQAAAEAIRGGVVETPWVESRVLSRMSGAEVGLKLENLQFTGSFKDRGALVKLLSLTPSERARGVIAMSAGNHGQAVAYHAQRLGVSAVIVMPRFTPSVKTEQTRGFGAEVILRGETLAEAGVLAREIAAERDLVFLHPYDDPQVIAGQGTIALEMLNAAPDLEVLVVPIGGGGLIAGIAVAAKALRPAIEIVGVEAARFPSMSCALRDEEARCGSFSIADGIAVKLPGRLTLPIVRKLVDEVLLVDEADMEQAVLLLLEVEKTVVEGAGAAGLAALRRYRDRFSGRRVGLVISGGNIDLPILSSIIQRGLVRSARLARLVLQIRDVPGELGKAAKCIGDTGANVVQVSHQRIFTELPVQATELVFVLQTRGRDHLEAVVVALDKAGYRVRVEGVHD